MHPRVSAAGATLGQVQQKINLSQFIGVESENVALPQVCVAKRIFANICWCKLARPAHR